MVRYLARYEIITKEGVQERIVPFSVSDDNEARSNLSNLYDKIYATEFHGEAGINLLGLFKEINRN